MTSNGLIVIRILIICEVELVVQELFMRCHDWRLFILNYSLIQPIQTSGKNFPEGFWVFLTNFQAPNYYQTKICLLPVWNISQVSSRSSVPWIKHWNLETAIEEIKSIWEKIENSESKKNHNIGDDFTDYAIIVNSKIYDKIHEDAGILMLLKALRYVWNCKLLDL